MDKLKIMVVDDEPVILDCIKDYLDQYPIHTYLDPKEAVAALETQFFDIVVSDFRMPGVSGLELFLEGKRNGSYSFGILLTAYADKQLLREFINRNLVKRVIEKPLDLDAFKIVIDEAIADCRREEEKRAESDAMRFWYDSASTSASFLKNKVIGFDGSLRGLFADIRKVADSAESVLLTGETGTGKELVARTIHLLSGRRNGPFVVINCGALPENLVESELFGCVKGAYTGAYADRQGKIERADGGTLFLDEVGELEPDIQAKLLRVIQEKEVERLGSGLKRKVDFRLVSATNRDIASDIRAGRFREDLYYRIGTIPLRLPPLRERLQDFEPLIGSIMDGFTEELGRTRVVLDPRALARLKAHSWPGNIRELENAIKRAVLLLDRESTVIMPETFDYLFSRAGEPGSLDSALGTLTEEVLAGRMDFKVLEKTILARIVERYGGNIKEAARSTSISKDKFYRKRL